MTFAAIGTYSLIALSLSSIVVRCFIMNRSLLDDMEDCERCQKRCKMKTMEFIGGAWFCDDCLDEFEAMPAPTAGDLELMDRYTERDDNEDL